MQLQINWTLNFGSLRWLNAFENPPSAVMSSGVRGRGSVTSYIPMEIAAHDGGF